MIPEPPRAFSSQHVQQHPIGPPMQVPKAEW